MIIALHIFAQRTVLKGPAQVIYKYKIKQRR